MKQYILGIDNGGSLSKAAVYAASGEMVSVASESVPQVLTRPGWSEREMGALWVANVEVMRRAVLESGVSADDIVAITLTGHGNGLYLIDEYGRPVRNGIVSNDSRAQGVVERWLADGSYRRECLDTTMQSLFAGAPLPLLAWLSEHEPENVRRTKHLLMVKDYIRFMLTGEIGFELTDASCTNLLDMTTRAPHTTLLERMGVGEWAEKIPPLVESTAVAGRVLPSVAAATGLAAGTPVYAGISDISASAIGVGAVHSNQLAVVTGTWSINEYFADEPVVDENLFMTSLAPMPGKYLVMEASPTSAANLEWLVTNVLRQLPGLSERSNKDLYRFCDEIVFGEGGSDTDVVFTPFVFGSNLHPGSLGGWSNVSNVDGLPQLLRAVYEGVAFSHREHVERLRGYTDLDGAARFTGGVAKSPEWTQLFADVLGSPLEIVDVRESGILGAVIVAAAAAGLYPSVQDAAAAMVPPVTTVEPSRPASDYDRKYDRWLRAVRAAAG